MSLANGTIGEIIKALDMAGAEMLAISLPDAYVIDATQGLVRRWGCTRYDMIGHQLSQSPEGLFQARYIDVDLTGLGTQTATRIEVTYRPPGRPARGLPAVAGVPVDALQERQQGLPEGVVVVRAAEPPVRPELGIL